MNKTKQTKEEQRRGITWLLIFVSPLIIFIIYSLIARNEKLEEYDVGQVIVTQTFYNGRKGKNHARYYYYYKDIKYTRSSEIYSFDVKVGDKFVVKISKSDPDVIDVDFSQKVTIRGIEKNRTLDWVEELKR